LKKIDPQQKYFLTINEFCKVKNVPKDRSNIAKVRYLNDSGDSYQKLEKKILDKKYCPVDLSAKPINLIMSDGGYDLIEITNVIDDYGIDGKKKKDLQLNKTTKHKIKTAQMLFSNLKECIKNLLQGLIDNSLMVVDNAEQIFKLFDASLLLLQTKFEVPSVSSLTACCVPIFAMFGKKK
jgi:hypothetical protein